LVYRYTSTESQADISDAIIHFLCHGFSISSLNPGKKYPLALLRYFTKKDNEQHVTGFTRVLADSRQKAELVDVESIVRYAFH
jgi:hypothetical protein